MPKKPKRKKEPHPTLFVFDGSLRWFEEGSMLELHTQVRDDEWIMIIEETIKYKCFIDCLKEYACPNLKEPWTEDDDWFRVQLDIAISRMRNIDALLVAKYDQAAIRRTYLELMKQGVQGMQVLIEQVRNEQKELIRQRHNNGHVSSVSDL